MVAATMSIDLDSETAIARVDIFIASVAATGHG